MSGVRRPDIRYFSAHEQRDAGVFTDRRIRQSSAECLRWIASANKIRSKRILMVLRQAGEGHRVGELDGEGVPRWSRPGERM